MERANQKEYLYNAISDVQDLIKFTESKAAFVIGILTAYVAIIFLTMENVIKYYSNWTCLLLFNYYLFVFLVFLCIWLIARIIIPIKKPTESIKISKDDIPEMEFYLAPNYYSTFLFPFFNSKKHKLEIDFKSYYHKVLEIDDETIVKVLTLELFKISYIRNIKSDRLKVLIYFLLVTSSLLIIFYIIYQIELSNILRCIAEKK